MIILIVFLIAMAFPVSASSSVQGGSNWRVFQGAWFEIKYPASFRVRPSLPSSSAHGYDSAFFAAPDGTVEFYVFSPQWNGTPSDIELDPRTEVLVSREVVQRGSKKIRRVTVKARDGRYLRSFEDTEDVALNTRKVFGISYANADSYNRYRQVYLTFKASLTQFSD